MGDMLELGKDEMIWHQWAGREAFQSGVHYIIACGGRAQWALEAAVLAGLPPARAVRCTSADEATSSLKMLIKPGDVVLVKGSRAVGLERVCDALATRLVGA